MHGEMHGQILTSSLTEEIQTHCKFSIVRLFVEKSQKLYCFYGSCSVPQDSTPVLSDGSSSDKAKDKTKINESCFKRITQKVCSFESE